jgi:hypothetical protein
MTLMKYEAQMRWLKKDGKALSRLTASLLLLALASMSCRGAGTLGTISGTEQPSTQASASNVVVAPSGEPPEQTHAERKKMSEDLEQAAHDYEAAEAALRTEAAEKRVAPTTKILYDALDAVGSAIASPNNPTLLDVYRGTKGTAKLDLYRAAADIRKAFAIDKARRMENH